MFVRFTVVVCSLLLAGGGHLFAQTRTGTTGTSGTTSSSSTSSAASSTSTGTTNRTTTTGATSGGNTGARPQTMSPIGNEPTFNAADGTLGDQVGQGFTGRQNTGFVGNRNAAQSNTGASSMQQFFNQFGNQNQRSNQNSSANSNVKRVRPQQRIAFTYPRVNLTQTQVDMGDRLGRLAKVQGGSTVVSDEGVATLTGRVASEDDKKLAEAMARLEPGVRSVKNDLVVMPTP